MTEAEKKVKYWKGYVVYPLNFPYLEAALRGRPAHPCDMTDPFAAKHPRMSKSKRAKQFAPFDALDGYKDLISARDVEYVERIEPEESDIDELDRRLMILHELTRNTRIARQNRISVTVTYFEPCSDENIFRWRERGIYRQVTGICWKVDADVEKTIKVGESVIPFSDIYKIEENEQGIFRYETGDLW